MTTPEIFVTRSLPERGLEQLKKHFSIEVLQDYGAPPKSVILEKARNVDGLVTLLSDEIDEEVFEAGKDLKIVAQYAVGYDNIAVEEATKRGIYIINTPGVLTETSADFAWALLMATARRTVEADTYVRNGEWNVGWHPKMFLGRDVHGAILGIIGLGRIGSAVAKRAQGFDMDVIYYNPSRKKEVEKELDVQYKEFDKLLETADFVSLHVPLTEDTYHMIEEKELKLMKDTAILINNARGEVINETALQQAIQNDWIAGAGLDVFEEEPTPKTNPLLEMDEVVVTPHISSASYETRAKMAEMVAENLIKFFQGEIPPNLVNKKVQNVREPGSS